MVRRSPYGFLEQKPMVILDLHIGPHCAFCNKPSLKLLPLMLISIRGEFRPRENLAEKGLGIRWFLPGK